MSKYHSDKNDFSKKSYLSSQKSLVERMLREIDDTGATVQSEGLGYLYVAQGDASLGAGKTSQKFIEATTRVSSMLSSAARLHQEILQNIDSKLVKGLDSAFESLNEVNGKKNPYKTGNTYDRTQTVPTGYVTASGYYTQTQTFTRKDHYTLDEILDGEHTPLQIVKTTYAHRVKHVRSQIAASDKLSEERIKEIESMSDQELIESFYPRLKADSEYQAIKMSTYQEVHKGELSMVDISLNVLAGLAMVGGIVLAPFTGGTSLYASYAAGTYIAGSSAYSAITGNTLITGERLNTVERTFAGIEAVTTVLSLGGTAVGSSGLKVGNQATKVLTTLGNVADKTDDVMDLVQLGYGIGTGDADSALVNFALNKGVSLGTKAVVGNLSKRLSVQPSQVQLNARQGQDFVELQTVEFGKVARKVENNITIKMMVDGVEQKIRVDAIGFDESGKIRIQEYTTAQNGLKLSRQNLLEDLSKYGGRIVGTGKGDFVGGVEIPKGTRIDVVSQKTGNMTIGGTESPKANSVLNRLSPADRKRVLEISENAPKVEYRPGKNSESVLSQPKGKRDDVETYLDLEYIKAHKQQFDNGAIKFQKFTPTEGGFNNGAIGNPEDHVAFVMPREAGETLIEVSKGDPRVLEELLGLHPGDLGESPVAIEIPAEAIRNPRIPSGNEKSAFDGYWKPGGRTYPGNMPEAVIDEVPWGEFTIRQLGGN